MTADTATGPDGIGAQPAPEPPLPGWPMTAAQCSALVPKVIG
jgi:hypothetical protein